MVKGTNSIFSQSACHCLTVNVVLGAASGIYLDGVLKLSVDNDGQQGVDGCFSEGDVDASSLSGFQLNTVGAANFPFVNGRCHLKRSTPFLGMFVAIENG